MHGKYIECFCVLWIGKIDPKNPRNNDEVLWAECNSVTESNHNWYTSRSMKKNDNMTCAPREDSD